MTTLFPRLFRARPQSRRGAATRPARRKPHLAVEALDQRVLPSVSTNLVNGQLQLMSNGGNDNISVSGDVKLTQTGLAQWTTTSTVVVNANFTDGSTKKSWDLSNVQSLSFSSGGGFDTFTNNTNLDSA